MSDSNYKPSKQEIMAIILKNAPKTEEGRKLQLTKEQEAIYRLVYRINEEKQRLEFHELWNPEEKYDNRFVVMPLTSTYKELEGLCGGTEMKNIIASSKDPLPNGSIHPTSWIDLIKIVYEKEKIKENPLTCCLTKNKYSSDNIASSVSHHGNKCIVGGHMVKRGKGQRVIRGDFYLLHICQGHNSNGLCRYYFKVKPAGTNALKMANYKQLNSEFLATLVNFADKDGDIDFDLETFCTENNIQLDSVFSE